MPRLIIALTEEQHSRFKAAAEKVEMPVSTWARLELSRPILEREEKTREKEAALEAKQNSRPSQYVGKKEREEAATKAKLRAKSDAEIENLTKTTPRFDWVAHERGLRDNAYWIANGWAPYQEDPVKERAAAKREGWKYD